MKIKKIILPILVLVLILSSCQKGGAEYDAANENMLQLGRDLAAFSSELDEDIASNTDSFALLVSSYEKRGELLNDSKNLMDEIVALEGIISDEDYDIIVEKMKTLNENIENSALKAEEYYESDACTKIEAFMDEYIQAENKAKWDNKSAWLLYDEINSMIVKSEGLHDQRKILGAYTNCIDTYTTWLIDSEEFAVACQSSDNRESSEELVNAYLKKTTEYYDILMTSDDELSSLMNKENPDNLDKYMEIHTAMVEEYQSVIEILNFILQQ